MDGCQGIHSLEFHDNSPIHEKTHSVTTVQLYAFVDHRQRFLAFKGERSYAELMRETLFIRGLE